MTSGTKHVVIVGGGFAGLWATRALAGDDVRITLVDRRNHHLFQPLLYQVATAGLSAPDIAAPLRHILRNQRNVEVRLGEVTGLDAAARSVSLADGDRLHYDYLLLASGATHAYFGHDEWAANAPGLKTLDDALGDAAVSTSQPALAAIKLAWWRDALFALDDAPPPGEPRLQAAAEQLLPRGITGAELAQLEDGWSALLEPEPEIAAVDAHGAHLFALGARLLGQEWDGTAASGAIFARAQARRRGLLPDAAAQAARLQRPVPAPLRPLTALALLAERDLAGETAEAEATPGRSWALVRHRLTGR